MTRFDEHVLWAALRAGRRLIAASVALIVVSSLMLVSAGAPLAKSLPSPSQHRYDVLDASTTDLPGVAYGAHRGDQLAARSAAVAPFARGAFWSPVVNQRFGVAAKAAGDAYDVAAAGGKHAGFLKNYAGRSPQEVDRGIRSIQREIADHQAAIRDPRTKIPNFDELDPRQQVALLTKKWPSDIARQQEQLAILQRLRSGG